MPRFMIQMPHSDNRDVCVRALHAIQTYGGHLVTNAEWGCKAGVHCGWAIVELSNREEALLVVPPEFRRDVLVVELNRFTKDEVAKMAAHLGG